MYKQAGMAMVAAVNGRKVALRNPEHNRYIVVEGALHLVHAHEKDHGIHGYFELIPLRENVVNIRSHHGHFIAIDKNGRVHTNHHPDHADSQFAVDANANLVCFRTINHGRHLGIHHTKIVEGNHSLTGGCCFQLLFVPFLNKQTNKKKNK